ncbi:molybdopterin molybdotransferase MoeA [Vogesella sp. DC21W]|uniref:Molybdopterin molybdenumtransferase n=1 Tax=Vogesella aquatica TaxID=2984206 RepID=A0ABT5ITQ7_9NEIS|nr:gephyrin-like molybdotransferase Glp [Vogesella aquatica]MBP7579588.1 molybdopterin molybdotransferase MoeA [Vogesella sp.]MDC7715942.1 molybdopterin molybdotransferase MoeA [Vogesella aquatica]
MQSVDATRDALLACARAPAQSEILPLLDIAHRVLARPLVARLDVPPHDNSAMDGYAVRSSELKPGVAFEVSQRLPAGSLPSPLLPASVARIFTGAMLPEGADAVVMQEHTSTLPDGRVMFDDVVRSGLNIRRRGEDITDGSSVLAGGLRLKPAHLGLAASVGVASLPVYTQLRVAVFFTGDELQEPGRPALPGHIYNANRYWLVPALRALGCEVLDLGIVPDRLADTRQLLRDAGQAADVVMTCGGVSVGEEDHVKAAVCAEGELQQWRVAIKPGKPLAFGRVGQADFIGLPGNPVAAWVGFIVLVRDFLRARQGEVLPRWQPQGWLPASFRWPRPDPRREEFLRVRVVPDGTSHVLHAYPQQGSAVLSSCVWSDGLARLQPGQVVEPGTLLPVYGWGAGV